jgi:hypothetical protein
MQHLKNLFCSLSPTPEGFFQHIYLAHIGTISLTSALALLYTSSLQTGCRAITISGISIPSLTAAAAASSSRCKQKKRKLKAVACLDTLQVLSIRSSRLSPLQWKDFLSRLTVPSIRQLEFGGEISMKAVYSFLLRHSTVRSLRFDSCTSKDTALFSHDKLTLPHLQILKGPLTLVSNLLRSLSSPPSLHELIIEYPEDLPIDTFIARVMDCLAMCKECLEVEVRHSHLSEEEIRVASAGGRILSLSTDIPTISSLLLCLKEISDEVLPVRNNIYSSSTILTEAYCLA